MELKTIAHIYTDFDEKFGIPRQSGLVKELKGRIVFEREYRDVNALRELDGYDYIWILWHFSRVPEKREFIPMVRPPRLGGNRKVGVFASRSPFRPNPVGLSCVRLERIEPDTPEGPVICVSGIDMLNGTPIFDIKPYQPRLESHPEARGGFTDTYEDYTLDVRCPEHLLSALPPHLRQALTGILREDPRPGYQRDESRIYGVSFAGYNVRFKVTGKILTVVDIRKILDN